MIQHGCITQVQENGPLKIYSYYGVKLNLLWQSQLNNIGIYLGYGSRHGSRQGQDSNPKFTFSFIL